MLMELLKNPLKVRDYVVTCAIAVKCDMDEMLSEIRRLRGDTKTRFSAGQKETIEEVKRSFQENLIEFEKLT